MRGVERFPYKSIIPGYPLQPVIEVEIKGSRIVDCLIDSGASISLFPASIGNDLGVNYKIPPDPKDTAECAHGDPIQCWRGLATIKIKDEEFTIPVLFTKSDRHEALLGRDRFFDKFRVTFDEASKEVILEKRSGGNE